jgi:hypothetical protein
MGKPLKFSFRCTHHVHSRLPNHYTAKARYPLASSLCPSLLILWLP